ncbi:hypothetical protein Poly51_02850 [Rubripirellula tenax]|uniref:Threonine/serine exporter family protein n=1 Tax=Rubripirellula tenax TaxID=2528015 RepID=A0A5C6FK13_9BACT|nr:threonine/serine exporter family protein [Rubripirellula tenax]TWU60012.1 hypothetical protein Poly51_02850 [Rubripirellula tenax]
MTTAAKRPLKQQFLIDAAIMLHRYGTPSHRLERVMDEVSQGLNVHSAFLYTPTALVISLDEDSAASEMTVIRRVDSGSVDVGKVIELGRVLGQVARGEVTADEAMPIIHRIDVAPSMYGPWTYGLACATACAAVAVFFGGTVQEWIAAAVVGILVTVMELLHARWKLEKGLLEPIAGVVASLSSILIARSFVGMDDRLVTLAGLILLIPGLRLTVALTELAVGHLSAGVARLAGAMVSLATLFIGVAFVWRMIDPLRVADDAGADLNVRAFWIALAVAPIAFAIVFRAGPKQWPIIMLVSYLGVLVSRSMELRFGVEVGAFLGALTIGCVSNLYARVRDIPAMVLLTPGMLILLPGSLGYRSLAALLERETLEGVQLGFSMVVIGLSLVGGLLVSNAIVPPRRVL